MANNIPGNIDPNTTSGTQLASLLNDLIAAYSSTNSGTSRPTNLLQHGLWLDTTDDLSGIWSLKQYNGTSDIELFKINKNTGALIIGANEDEIQVVRSSDDSVGALMSLIKERVAGGGQTLINDVLGEILFKGTENGGVTRTQAKITTVSVDDVTSAEYGAYMAFHTTAQDGNTLQENMRLTDNGKLGIGETAPEKTIHAKSSAADSGVKTTKSGDNALGSALQLHKKRIAASGQVLNNDNIGGVVWSSTDSLGAEIDVAKIEVLATENHTNSAHGSELILSTKKNGSTTFEERIKVDQNGNVLIAGQSQNDTKTTEDLLDDAATRNLLTIDGDVYGSVILEVQIQGRNNSPEVRAQNILLKAVYDHNNTTWHYSTTDDILTDTDPLVELDFSNTVGKDFVVDYVNQFVAAQFVDGKIYKEVRRFLR